MATPGRLANSVDAQEKQSHHLPRTKPELALAPFLGQSGGYQ
jgi:hypothetical protein